MIIVAIQTLDSTSLSSSEIKETICKLDPNINCERIGCFFKLNIHKEKQFLYKASTLRAT